MPRGKFTSVPVCFIILRPCSLPCSFYMMYSPVDQDHLPESSSGFTSMFVPEELIVSSQPSLFLQEITGEIEGMANHSVVIEEHHSQKQETEKKKAVKKHGRNGKENFLQ